MPVTTRSLLVHKFSGSGKKAPTNLRYDPAKKQVVNSSCGCDIVSNPVLLLDGGSPDSQYMNTVDGGPPDTEYTNTVDGGSPDT